MISTLVLIISFLLIFSIAAVIARSVITKQQIFGRPPIPVVFFILAKMLVVVNLTFPAPERIQYNGHPAFCSR